MNTQTLEHDTDDAQVADDTEWEPESPARRVQRSVYATVWRCRRPLLPHALAASVAGGGLGLQAVAAAGSSPAGLATITALAGIPLAAGVSAAARKRHHRWWARITAAAFLAAGWLTTAPFGVSAGHLTVLVAAEYALAARWWQINRLGYPADPEVPVLEQEERTPAGRIIDDWDTYVGNQSGPIPGSRLSLPLGRAHTTAFALDLHRGKQSLQTVLSNLPKIATGLDEPVENLIAEAWPTSPGEKPKPSRCLFQVVTNSPIAGDVDFAGPSRQGGLIGLGPWADGSGEAQFRLYTPGSMWSTVVIGGTGIGKSRIAENFVISALSGGDTVFWYLDPQGGASSPALAEHADWFATMRNADDMCDAAVAILDARGEENSFEGWTGFTASPQRPGLLIVVEECHNPFGLKPLTPLWTRISREGRKVGVAILCLSQYPGLETFGNAEAMRLNIMAGNAVALHSTSNSSGGLMAGLEVNPKTLPKIPGYAYAQGSPETGTRTAPFRNRNTAPGGDSDFTRRWLAAQPRPGLDTLAVTATLAAGTAYRDRHVSTSTGRAASAARVEALRGGHLPADMIGGRAEQSAVSMGDMGNVIEFPAPLRPEDLEQREAAPARPATGLSASHKAVLDAVGRGIDRPSQIEDAVGLSARQVQNLLNDLLEAGLVTKPRYGRYQRAA